jgi:hypothetical protein
MGAGIGMPIVETIAKIRRAYFVQQKPIKAIRGELGLSRKVVRKVLRSDATEFRYTREMQPLPKIGPYRDSIDALLLVNEGKAPRENLTPIRVFEALCDSGYDGSYDAVRRYAKGSPALRRPRHDGQRLMLRLEGLRQSLPAPRHQTHPHSPIHAKDQRQC